MACSILCSAFCVLCCRSAVRGWGVEYNTDGRNNVSLSSLFYNANVCFFDFDGRVNCFNGAVTYVLSSSFFLLFLGVTVYLICKVSGVGCLSVYPLTSVAFAFPFLFNTYHFYCFTYLLFHSYFLTLILVTTFLRTSLCVCVLSLSRHT